MKIIEAETQFDTFYEARGKIFVILEQEERKLEDTEETVFAAAVVEITQEEKSNPTLLKAKLYREVADPLYFKSQRDEATKQEWLDVVERIRNIVA